MKERIYPSDMLFSYQAFSHAISLSISIHIYQSIYLLSPTNRLFLSYHSLFNVGRHAERFQLKSKPTQIYVRFNILPLSLIYKPVFSK